MSGAVIAGRVRTNRGKPVVEAGVYIASAPVDVPDIAALTDEEGQFALSAPAPGSYVIECSAIGYAPGTVIVNVVEEGTLVEVELELGRPPVD